ncbi:MAG: family 78 glycoside hydrolase catalytic domain [Clostridia bacterium]|nr:family 78 glycoside hydrolase catalytic domain [Clostridia bacterium]
MNKITGIYMNYSPLKKTERYRITESLPVFSWAVKADYKDGFQKAFVLKIKNGKDIVFDSGVIESAKQEYKLENVELPCDCKLYVEITVLDNRDEWGTSKEEYFYVAGTDFKSLRWIAPEAAEEEKALYFRKKFTVNKTISRAVLYACGLGYHKLYINGVAVSNTVLDPLFSDYSKDCYYVMEPEVADKITEGENCIGIVIGEGWRRNGIVFPANSSGPDQKVRFAGVPQLSALLNIYYEDGTVDRIETDPSWKWSYGAIVKNNIFNGETYDANYALNDWNRIECDEKSFEKVSVVQSPGGVSRIMTAEPIVEQEVYRPVTTNQVNENTYVVDFGQNMAGITRIKLPENLKKGQRISITHSEFINEDSLLYMATYRNAASTDVYIASGDERDLKIWQPLFTYHGFRYAQISGLSMLDKDDIVAVSVYSDIQSESRFFCGSGLVNSIHKLVLQTEKSNIHGLFTDCPQRDERMGWMNDATVRFEETPYNFDIGRMMPKIIQDVIDTQDENGAITCTAPYLWGNRPADPVCASPIVAGLQCYLHTGNLEILQRAYDMYAGWVKCLGDHSENYLVNYSYYGDWAGPGYACLGGDEGAESIVTPGLFMSSGYYYFDAMTMSRFAKLLGKTEDEIKYRELAERIKAAILDKWWDDNTGKMCTGSQGSQSFALWLGIIPENKRKLAAAQLRDDLVKCDYRITTGNLNTRYMMDMLAEYGYIDDAWEVITREEYPSFGYMLQLEATTVWERFEFKKTSSMNSHNHPMYGAIGYWFYAYICGIKPTSAAYDTVDIKPYFPKKLLSANASLQTIKGELSVRWVKHFGKTYLYINIPFGVTATLYFGDHCEKLGSGFYVFEKES